jgi:serine/threonine protein kinase/beta-lactam-binding protein with PASTA domain
VEQLIGKVLGNRYEIVEKIGSGGMSQVYKARCGLLNRYVAVKVLRPEYTSDENFIRKFRRESQAAASLSHQNIVSVYDVGVDDDVHYIVMEYIEGKTLKQMIREKGRLTAAETAEIAQQICKALVHAHKNHIIHRDIKPHNILVTKDGVAKVTDFGIARAVTASTVTNSGSVIGSVHYFSPEQARGGFIDEKSDLYSLGIVMYEMITGQVPFEGESPISIALKHLQEPVKPPARVAADIPLGLEQIIMKAIEKEPGRRYNTAEELLADLNSFIKNNRVVFSDRDIKKDDNPTIVMPAVKGCGKENGDESKVGGRTDDRKYTKKKFPVLTAVIALILLVALGFAASFIARTLLYVDVVKVPKVLGESEEDAKEILERVGLKMEVRDRQHNMHFEEGTVIQQYPNEGTENKVTNPVLVVVSLGPEKTKVPFLINKSSAEALLELQAANLKEGEITTRYSDTVAVGVVMDQYPDPGKTVDEGTEVDLVISSGPDIKQVVVPSVLGDPLQTAENKLINAGLVIADKFRQDSDTIPEGRVISQSIEPNSVVDDGSSIVLVISSGKKADELDQREPVERTVVLNIDLPAGQKDLKVTVKKYQDGVEEIEYQRRHDANEGPLKVPVKGKGKVRVVVLFNDVIHSDGTIDFSKEE